MFHSAASAAPSAASDAPADAADAADADEPDDYMPAHVLALPAALGSSESMVHYLSSTHVIMRRWGNVDRWNRLTAALTLRRLLVNYCDGVSKGVRTLDQIGKEALAFDWTGHPNVQALVAAHAASQTAFDDACGKHDVRPTLPAALKTMQASTLLLALFADPDAYAATSPPRQIAVANAVIWANWKEQLEAEAAGAHAAIDLSTIIANYDAADPAALFRAFGAGTLTSQKPAPGAKWAPAAHPEALRLFHTSPWAPLAALHADIGLDTLRAVVRAAPLKHHLADLAAFVAQTEAAPAKTPAKTPPAKTTPAHRSAAAMKLLLGPEKRACEYQPLVVRALALLRAEDTRHAAAVSDPARAQHAHDLAVMRHRLEQVVQTGVAIEVADLAEDARALALKTLTSITSDEKFGEAIDNVHKLAQTLTQGGARYGSIQEAVQDHAAAFVAGFITKTAAQVLARSAKSVMLMPITLGILLRQIPTGLFVQAGATPPMSALLAGIVHNLLPPLIIAGVKFASMRYPSPQLAVAVAARGAEGSRQASAPAEAQQPQRTEASKSTQGYV